LIPPEKFVLDRISPLLSSSKSRFILSKNKNGLLVLTIHLPHFATAVRRKICDFFAKTPFHGKLAFFPKTFFTQTFYLYTEKLLSLKYILNLINGMYCKVHVEIAVLGLYYGGVKQYLR
jgi:hypothetical protein